eukprot:10246191-Ditylum_brightwellii.AAC.1
MKELKRVYENLCFYSDKVHALERLKIIKETLLEMQRAEKGRQKDLITSSYAGENAQSRSEVEKLEAEQSKLYGVLNDIRKRSDQHIRPQDTAAAMKGLGRRVTKKEVHDMMWEVDEKLDGVIDWEEFRLMFERNIRDTTGLEPATFYHMVQFMIYDGDGNGMVSIDETMNMLYARLGRERMETTITKLFGSEDGAPVKEVGQQGGEIDFG